MQILQGIRTNWVPSPTATIVTNGEGEWESTASSCSALVVCPEAADIPGSTVTALLSRMDRCERIVVVSPAGTVTGEPIKNEEEVSKLGPADGGKTRHTLTQTTNTAELAAEQDEDPWG